MKILIQNSIFYPQVIGGAEISSHLLGQELRRRGLACDAVASTGRHGSQSQVETRPTEDGLGTVFEAPAHGLCDLLPLEESKSDPGFLTRSLNHFSMIYSRRWHRIFTAVLEKSAPDLVHTNTLVGMTPAIWSAAQAKGIAVVHTLRDYHLLCPRTTLLRSDQSDCQNPPLPCRVLAGFKLRQTGPVQLVTAPTHFVLKKHLDAGGFAQAATAVVPNALEEWPEEIPPPSTGGPVRGLFMGQIQNHKGISLLLEALEQLFQDPGCQHLHFDFAGVGPLTSEVKSFCAAHPLRARYHGMVRGEPRREILRQASFMVVPSIWFEPFSRSIIDGFSWGLPAIGSNQGGIPEVIRDQQDGLVVEPRLGPLTQAIKLMVTDEKRRHEMSLAARSGAQRFTLKQQVDTFENLYRQLLKPMSEGRRKP